MQNAYTIAIFTYLCHCIANVLALAASCESMKDDNNWSVGIKFTRLPVYAQFTFIRHIYQFSLIIYCYTVVGVSWYCSILATEKSLSKAGRQIWSWEKSRIGKRWSSFNKVLSK